MERKENKQIHAEVNKLTDLIKNLKLKQEEINKQITEAEILINNISHKTNNNNTNNNRNNRTVIFEYGDFRTGDKVRIKNPKGQQQNKGILIGVTKSGFARIQTDNGEIIRRVQNNITKTK